MTHAELPIEKGICVFKNSGFSLYSPCINRFATVVRIIHSLPDNSTFNSRQIQKYLEDVLKSNGERVCYNHVSNHFTVLRYLGQLGRQKYIERGCVQYATFQNGGKGYSSFYKRNPLPELFIKQTFEPTLNK